jgi:hypothetical protein
MTEAEIITYEQLAVPPSVRESAGALEGRVIVFNIADIVPIEAISSEELVAVRAIPIVSGIPYFLQIFELVRSLGTEDSFCVFDIVAQV